MSLNALQEHYEFDSHRLRVIRRACARLARDGFHYESDPPPQGVHLAHHCARIPVAALPSLIGFIGAVAILWLGHQSYLDWAVEAGVSGLVKAIFPF